MDQLYALFKSIVRKNLQILGSEDVGMLVFGGVWISSNGSVQVELENAFKRVFSKQKVIHA
jgi:hypothetical protein